MRIIVCLIAVFMFVNPCFAHPPSDIQAKIEGAKVEITVVHQVENPNTHFINKMEISLNGKQIIIQNYNLQYDEKSQKGIYFIPALKNADKLSIEADCNMFGELKKDFVVP